MAKSTSSNPQLTQFPSAALRSLCTRQISHEASLLTSALQAVHAMETAFRQRNPDLAASLRGHEEVARRIAELEERRRDFGLAAARLLGIAPQSVNLLTAVDRLSEPERTPLLAELNRLRASARELAALVGRVSVFLRIHADAYQRILRDLTRSGTSSGRYGPTGNAETHEYRPLLQIHG